MNQAPFSSLIILLVEDDPDISAIATLGLQLDPGLTVVAAMSAAQALDRLTLAPTPDLVLIDRHLPDMDGLALADALNKDRSSPLPVIFLTAAVRASDQDEYAEAGAIGVITKPFDPLTLASSVRRLLEQS